MKILRIIRKEYAILGVGPSNQSTCSFSNRVVVGFLLFAWLLSSQTVYVFYVANGFIEYIECMSSQSAGIIIFIAFAVINLRKITVFEGIDGIERLIATSETVLKFEFMIL